MKLFKISLKTKYLIKVFLTPKCWIRINKYNKQWDKKLWNALVAGKIEYVSRFEAYIDEDVVWISNYPYANGSIRIPGDIFDEPLCSRKTALFLQDQLPAARIMQNLRGPHNKIEVYQKTGFFL